MWIKNERTLCRCVNKNTWFDVLFLCLTIFLLFFALSSFLQKDFHRIGLRARHRLNKPQFYSHTIPNQAKSSQKPRKTQYLFWNWKNIWFLYYTHEHIRFMCGLFKKRFVQEHFWNFNGWNEFDWACPVQNLLTKGRDEWVSDIFVIQFFSYLPFLSLFTYQMYGVFSPSCRRCCGFWCSFVNRLVVGYAHNFHK